MIHKANVPKDLKHLVMSEAVKTATKLDNLLPVAINGVNQSRYKHFLGKNPAWIKGLRTFGEAGTVKIKTRNMHPKEADRVVMCMFIGYLDDYP
jgi:hypothetical protein